MSRLLIWLIRGYQLVVSPWFAPRCRFSPSCSAYALEAVQRHGAARGSWLAARRLLRCHPWNPGGLDPVPPSGRPRVRDLAPGSAIGANPSPSEQPTVEPAGPPLDPSDPVGQLPGGRRTTLGA